MATKQGQIPELTDVSPAGLQRWAKALKQSLMVMTADVPLTDSASLDIGVTFRDLIDAGIAIEAPPGSKTKILGGDGGAFIYTAPPAPTNFQVFRLPFRMRLTWDAPAYTNHLLTEIWRSDDNNLSTAIKLATVPAGITLYEDSYSENPSWYYWIRFMSKALIYGAFNDIQGTSDNSEPGDVSGLTYEFEGFGVRLKWNPVLDADLAGYEIRYGNTWDTAALLETTKSTSYLWKVQTAGTHRIFVRAKDVTGFYSGSASSVDVVILPPAQTSFTSSIVGDSLSLSWQSVVGTFAIDYYELRTGNDWASATLIEKAFNTAYYQKVNWAGTKRFWVAARDVAGNYASPISTDILIQVPTAPTSVRAEVVDNSVLLYWAAPTTHTLPIVTYKITKGVNAGDELIGEKSGQFTTIFEQVSGNYTYWIQAVDSAGNIGAGAPVTAKVSQPPDYVLYSDQNPSLSGTTRSSADWDGTGIVLPFNTTETWDQHYTTRSWTTDDNAIAAGFPVYAQPTPSSGYFEFTISYGSVIPATSINVTPTMLVIAGTPSYTCQISHKLNIGDSWTDLPVGTGAFIATTFSYVKVRITATNGGDQKGVYRCPNVNVKLNVKQKTVSGQGTCLSSDTNGTVFTLTNSRVTKTGNCSSGTNTLTGLSNTTGITVGMTVECSVAGRITPGTNVVSIDSSTQVTLSANSLASSTGATFAFADTMFSDLLGPPLIQPKKDVTLKALIPVVDFLDQANPQTFSVYLFNDSGGRETADISWLARGV